MKRANSQVELERLRLVLTRDEDVASAYGYTGTL